MHVRRTLVAAALAVAFAGAAHAQAPSTPPGVANSQLGALITLTAQGAGTVTSPTQLNTYHKGAICTFNSSAQTGTPSSIMSIQFYDKPSNQWQTYLATGAITAQGTPTSIMVYPGAVAAAAPVGMVISGLHLTKQWRASVTVAGTSPVVTGTIGCELLN